MHRASSPGCDGVKSLGRIEKKHKRIRLILNLCHCFYILLVCCAGGIQLEIFALRPADI